MNDVTLTKQKFDKLVDDSCMLSKISFHVEDFFVDEGDTTLIAVFRLLLKYHELKAETYFNLVDKA